MEQEKQFRIALVSDMHGNWQVMAEAMKQNISAEGPIDYIMCMGDYASDGRQLERELGVSAYVVHGNCDALSNELEEQIVELGEWKFLICHGHRYNVKKNLQAIYYRGLELNVDFVLYGHTHQAVYEENDAVTLINPGAAEDWNLRFNTASWGLLTLPEKKSEKFLRKYEKKACQTL